MSFAGTLICCAFGGLVYKYGDQRHTLLEPPEELGVQDYTVRFAKTKIKILKRRFKDAVASLVPGLSTPGIYLYPLVSYWELLSTPEYWKSSVPIMVVYLLLYALVTFVYLLTILPVYTPLSVFLGPIGLIVAWIHMFLHTNMLTMMTIRMSQMNSFTMYQGMAIRSMDVNIIDAGNDQPIKYYYPLASTYFFFNHLPWKLAEYFAGFIVLCGLLLISSIPILGPFIFHTLISPFITRLYWAPYLRYLKVDNLQRETRFYKMMGQYIAFGLVAGQFESWPIVSALAYSAHAIAICQWAQDLPTLLN
ncbi:Lds2 [Kluyveromyces lactis]|nr:Lds2 [Kluyveromyces lactis]